MQKFSITVTVFIVLALGAQAGPFYGVVDLGTLGGGESYGAGLSSTGSVAGWSADPAGDLRAFSFSGAMVGLSGGSESQANGVNASGTVAGTVYTNGQAQATVWEAGNPVSLGTLGGSQSYATAINDRGQVVGSASDINGQGRAFIYDGGRLDALGGIAGWQWSTAAAVDENGYAAGTAQLASGEFRGVVWDSAGVPVELGTLGGSASWAMGMNDNGLVAGASTTDAGWMHAFLYRGGAIIDLGTLGGGNSGAYDVNAAGWVVGYSLLEGGASVAFLYADGVLYNLNSLIGNGGWDLQQAMTINDQGQIVGSGTYNGEVRAFRLDPLMSADGVPTINNPEPGTMGLLLGGGGLIAMGLYRRKRCPK